MDIGIPNYLMLVLILLITGITIFIGVYRNRRFVRWQKKHEAFANKLGLKIAYSNPKAYKIFGKRGPYELFIEPIQLSDKEESDWATRITFPMQNPNLKALRIIKYNGQFPEFDNFGRIDRPTDIPYKIGEGIKIETNDPLFSHLVLTDDIKMDIAVAFKKLDTSAVYIYADELSAVIPSLIHESSDKEIYHSHLELLFNIKEELNG